MKNKDAPLLRKVKYKIGNIVFNKINKTIVGKEDNAVLFPQYFLPFSLYFTMPTFNDPKTKCF